MFRAEVMQDDAGWSVRIEPFQICQIDGIWFSERSDADQLAAQINAGAGAVEFNAAAIREAVRMEREAVRKSLLKWADELELGASLNSVRTPWETLRQAEKNIERGEHLAKGGAE